MYGKYPKYSDWFSKILSGLMLSADNKCYVSVMIAGHSSLGLSATRDTQPNLLNWGIFLGLIWGRTSAPSHFKNEQKFHENLTKNSKVIDIFIHIFMQIFMNNYAGQSNMLRLYTAKFLGFFYQFKNVV